MGSTAGMPDLLLRFPGAHASDYLPVELKIAHFMRKDPERIRAEKIRALQVNWHSQLSSSGGWSCFLLGVPGTTGFTAYVLASCGYGMLRLWQKGWALESLTCVAQDDKLDLAAWEQAMERWRVKNDRPTPLDLDLSGIAKRRGWIKAPRTRSLNLTEWMDKLASK